MKRNRNHRFLDRVTDEASDWFVRLQDPADGEEDRAEFAEWLAASPNNVREYLQVAALWEDLEDLGPDPQIDELVRAAQASHDENVVPLFDSPTGKPASAEGESTPTERWRRRIRRTASVAAVIVIALAVSWMWRGAGPTDYRTAVGEQNSFVLSDGSVVTLNTQSEIRVRFTSKHRDITLVGGEALFDVARDIDRLFRVSADGADIRAVGTRFNVRNRERGTTITVLEGIVEVILINATPGETQDNPSPTDGGSSGPSNPVELTVGQMAKVDRQSGQVAVAEADIEQATAWRERRLVFESRTLREVIDEFNLYNETPMIIGDPALDRLQISGAFNADDHDSFILFLEETGLATAQTDPSGRTTLQRSTAAVR